MKTKLLIVLCAIYSISAFSQSSLPSYVPTSGLVAWYSFSGNTNDQSGHHHDLINHGATLANDRCGNANSAYYFDGDTSYMASVDTFFDNGWQHYSISFWLYTDTTTNPFNGNQSQTMFNTEPHYGSEISLSWGGGTSKYDYFYNTHPGNNGGWDVFGNNAALSNSRATTHTWHHVSLVKSDTTYKMYIDGVHDNTFHNPAAAISYLCQVYVGTISDYSPETFWGYLDDYGIWNRSLTDGEVWQLYSNNCTTASACIPTTGLVAWYPFNGNTNDISGNHHDLVNHGATLATDRCGNPNSAYYFDGNTSFMSSVDTFFDNGWHNYSVTLWLNTDTTTNPYNNNQSQTMFNTEPHYGTELSLSWGGGTSKYDYFYNNDPNNNGWGVFGNNTALSNSYATTHTWHHVALVKADTLYKLYVDGAPDNTFHSQTAAVSYLCQIYVGTISDYSPETFWGYLDDYGIWNRALSDAEVLQVYNACCSAAGIKETLPPADIHVYPNPANNTLYVKIKDASLAGLPYAIVDELGRTILSGQLDTDGQTIDIRALAPAMYLLKVGQDKSLTYKIVKQ